ncbi:hypothetical protein QTP86_020244, partial [Hemibagrus guttatus]
GDEEVMGKFGVKERNLEGQMVVDFAKRMDMAVVNTYFQKRVEHRVTYKSGGRRTQKKRSKIEIEKKTKWWKLKKEECCEEFRQKLRQALGGKVVLPDDWETTAEVIRETGRKVLGVSSGRRKEDKETWWLNEEVHDSIQRKRLAKKKWDMDRTEENRQEYKELQRRVKREVSKAKQKAYDELYTRLDTREGEKDLYRKSTTDAIFALRILMEKYRDGQRELHCVFVDLEKAYDRVPREELWYCMRKSGVAEKYVRVVQDMYERSRTVVRCAVGQTEEFKVEVGLHQVSALSPFLFAIVMVQLSEEVRQESPWTMMFADDIVICSESGEQVEENLERWRFALERRGMKVSRSKTEYMCVKEREGSGTVRLQGEEMKKVQEFKYLGSTVQSNGECGKEGDRNNGFDVLYHNMKHGQISSKELADFIRERATIEETYSRAITKLAKTASNFSQLGTFAPAWDVFKVSTEKLAVCHMDLVRKLQDLIKEVQKYAEEQTKAHKKTKEEVAPTLEAVQNIQSVSQALQKSKENYNSKILEQERMRKEGSTQRDLDKSGVKVKKAREAYKTYVEKYASTKTEFEQKMEETAQKFQDIEESHIVQMKEIIRLYSHLIEDTHKQIGEVQKEFVINMENTSVESLLQKLAESKGTGRERPGPIDFEECTVSLTTEVAKPRKRKAFAIPGRRKEKDTDSTESTEVEPTNTANGAPSDNYGPIDFQNALNIEFNLHCFVLECASDNNSSSSDSDEEDERRKFHVEIKPVQPNSGTQQHKASIDELKASIGNITLSPSAPVHMRRNQSSDELGRSRTQQESYTDRLTSNDLLSLDPFGPNLSGAPSSVSSSADEFFIPIPPSPPRAMSTPPTLLKNPGDAATPLKTPNTSIDLLSFWTQNQLMAFVPFGGLTWDNQERPWTVPISQFAKTPFSKAADSFISMGQKKESNLSWMEDYAMIPAACHMQDVPPSNRPTTPLNTATIVPPPRPSSRPKLPAGKLSGINEIARPFSPSMATNSSPLPAPLARAESSSSLSSNTSLSASNTPTIGTSRGPSPITLASQDSLPIAVAFTESVNAYFKGADPSKCIVKITGEMTLSFPSGIIKIFTSSPSPAVLTFKLRNTSKLEQILPNQHLLHSETCQNDTNTKDFWMNMPALTAYLRKASEQNPTSSYYNVDILKYQVCSNGIQSTPLNLAVYWKCAQSTTDLRVDYHYNPEAMQPPGSLCSVQVLVPVSGGVTNIHSLPSAIWNPDQSKLLWKLNDLSEKSENEGSGTLRAKFELSDGPSIPATLAVQFFNEGSTISGVEMELAGSGYRLSLNKKRLVSGRYMADC